MLVGQQHVSCLPSALFLPQPSLQCRPRLCTTPYRTCRRRYTFVTTRLMHEQGKAYRLVKEAHITRAQSRCSCCAINNTLHNRSGLPLLPWLRTTRATSLQQQYTPLVRHLHRPPIDISKQLPPIDRQDTPTTSSHNPESQYPNNDSTPIITKPSTNLPSFPPPTISKPSESPGHIPRA